jgi:glycerate kinase
LKLIDGDRLRGGVGLEVISDVDTPYENAARLFAPQKGADPAAVERLTARLDQFAAATGPLRRAPRPADAVISGERRIDHQSLRGKLVDTVAGIASISEASTLEQIAEAAKRLEHSRHR